MFREVGGDGAAFFDPRDPSDIARVIRSLEDDTVWNALSAKAPAQAAKFTWDRSAANLLELARSLVS